MKLFFLFSGFIACTAASAQQKDLFNIDEHLKKKMGDVYVYVPLVNPKPPVQLKLQPATTVMPTQPLTYTLTNNDVVHYGNGTMPCIKPDMSQFPNLANAGEAAKDMLLNGPMPNGAVRK